MIVSTMTKYQLKLFVTGHTITSKRAVTNIQRICEESLADRYELTIIDVLQEPQAAEDAKVLATPTLLKISPTPVRRIVGDLSNTEKVLIGLDLDVELGMRTTGGHEASPL